MFGDNRSMNDALRSVAELMKKTRNPKSID